MAKPILDLDKVKDDLAYLALVDYTVAASGSIYFRYDYAEREDNDMDDEYSYVAGQLREAGYQLNDPCIEHDCISGVLEAIEGWVDPNPTLEQKVAVYESLLHSLHFASTVTMNAQRMQVLLSAISNWSYAHRVGNGEYTESEQAARVLNAFKAIAALEHVILGENHVDKI